MARKEAAEQQDMGQTEQKLDQALDRIATMPAPAPRRPRLRMTAASLTEVAEHFEHKAQQEDVWAERAKSAHDKRRAQIRAEVFREVAVQLSDTTISGEGES